MLITSNVFNRIDWSVNGVEYRTGCYIQNIDLGFIKTNFMNEPDFSLCIRFNQYDNSDEGFGTGWNLNLSCIKSINNRKLLRLGNGSVYWMKEQSQPVPASGRTLELEDQYCKTFYCTEYPDNLISVFYKSGIREDIRDGYLSSVLYPNGYCLYFQYQDGCLISIYDGLKNTPLSISYDRRNSDNIVVSVTNQRRKDDYYLNKNKSGFYELNSVLTTSESGSEALSLYTFQYQVYESNYLLITSLTSALEHNRKENIRYEELKRPSGLSSVIKSVSENDIYSGASEDEKLYVTVKYETTDNFNFLGAGAGGVTQWQNEKDNLFLLTGYKISRKVISGNQTVSYVYNNDYLITEKAISPSGPNKKKNKIITAYSYLREDPDHQGEIWSSFFLPVNIKEYAENNKLSGIPAVQFYRYDKYGNILECQDRRGIKTIFTYYDGKKGEQDKCPPDPFGFDNYIKEKIVIPAGNDIPYKKSMVYHYSTLRNCTLVKVKHKEKAVEYNAGNSRVVNEIKDFDYFSGDSGAVSILMSGVLKEEKTSIVNDGVKNEIVMSDIYQYSVDVNKKTISYSKDIVSGEVSFNKVTGITTNYHTGDTEEEKKEGGKTIRYVFDKLGRKKEIISFYSDINNNIRCVYTYDDKKGSVNRVSSDKSNVVNSLVYNRRGNVISEKIKVSEYEIFLRKSYQYDGRNRIIKEITYDYSFDGNKKYPILICNENKIYKWNYNDDVIMLGGSGLIRTNINYDYIKRVKTVKENKGKMVRSKINVSGDIYEKITVMKKRTEKYTFNGFGLCSEKTIIEHGNIKSKTVLLYNEQDGLSEEKITADGRDRIQLYSYDKRFGNDKLSAHYLNKKRIEANEYDLLGRVILKERNQCVQQLRYNPVGSSSHPECIKTGSGNEWRYTRTSGDKLNEIVLSTPSLPHRDWKQSFTYNDKTGELLKEEAVCELNNTGRYILSESYSDSGYNIKKKTIDYQFCKNECKHIEYLLSECKYSSEGKVISSGNDAYREIYKYNRSSGNIESIWYVIDGTVRCFCKPAYDKNNRMINVVVYTYVADDKQRNTRLYTKLRYDYYYNARGNIHKAEILSDNSLIGSSGERKSGNLEQLSTLILNYDVNDRIEMTKIDLFSPPDKSRHHEKRSERHYKESYHFNNLDELIDCKYSGDLSLTNNTGRILSGQSHKYNEDGLIILSTRRFSSGGSDIVSYDYDDKSATLNTLTHCPFKAGWPETEKYAWNKDGMLISRIRSDGYKEEYEYGGEQNVARMTITDPDNRKTIKTFLYDCHGHPVIQIIQSPPLYSDGPAVFRQIHDTYNNDHLMIRKIFDRELVDTSVMPEETHYYHWLQNQVIAVSVQDNAGNIKTHFNFNRPDGTTICRCSPTNQLRYVKPGIFDYRLKMEWIAQDQQGLFYQPELIELQQVCFEMNLTPPKV
ncbi:hypothetical protein [Morganella morganii]|uniref:hypothetical protein n=1 Tax=Morganella morganii TaxID=582 RepID=UPI000912B3DA|nr:hypothetical protein [Morganella morganii]SHM67106.1 hypothetical protein SAMN05216301_2785 [Morganella morganii]